MSFLCIFFSFQNKIHWNNYQNKQRSKRRTLNHQQIRKILKQQKSDKKKIPSGFWRHKATNLRTMVTSSSLLFTHFSVNQFVSSLQPRSFWPTATGIYAWVALLQKPRSPLWAPILRGEGILGLEAHWPEYFSSHENDLYQKTDTWLSRDQDKNEISCSPIASLLCAVKYNKSRMPKKNRNMENHSRILGSGYKNLKQKYVCVLPYNK